MIVTDRDILGASDDLKLPIAQNLQPMPWGNSNLELPKRSEPAPELQPGPSLPTANEPGINPITPPHLFHTERVVEETMKSKSATISPRPFPASELTPAESLISSN